MEIDGKLIKEDGHDYLKDALSKDLIDTFVDASYENELLDFEHD